MSTKVNDLIDEHGLPRYFDMQAKLGYTKHIGGSDATRELLEMCRISGEKTLLNVGCGAGTTTPSSLKTTTVRCRGGHQGEHGSQRREMGAA